MQVAQRRRAIDAARSIASSLGLAVDDVTVLQDSNRLTLRLRPADVVAQVAPAAAQVARLEVDVARWLADLGCPVAVLDPRVAPAVHERDGFVVTLWTYYATVTDRPVRPVDYAAALDRLHGGLRRIAVTTPHWTDRVRSAQRLLADRDRTPALPDGDRDLLAATLERLVGVIGERADEQLLHGEPHPGNVLATADGLRFIDLETCCRGPVELDLAHAPEDVGAHYPRVDRDLLRHCRTLVLAMITTWRWDRDDQLPDGRRLGTEWLGRLRAGLTA